MSKEFKEYLRMHLNFLVKSAAAFDRGETDEAVRIVCFAGEPSNCDELARSLLHAHGGGVQPTEKDLRTVKDRLNNSPLPQRY